MTDMDAQGRRILERLSSRLTCLPSGCWLLLEDQLRVLLLSFGEQ
jgi:hypothetical protein